MPHWIDAAEGFGDPRHLDGDDEALEVISDEGVAADNDEARMQERLEELELMEELHDVPDLPAGT
jgi:hypothetical protein